MAQILIKLELDDIITRPFGCNFAITPENGPIAAIILSREAAQELAADLAQLLDSGVEIVEDEEDDTHQQTTD